MMRTIALVVMVIGIGMVWGGTEDPNTDRLGNMTQLAPAQDQDPSCKDESAAVPSNSSYQASRLCNGHYCRPDQCCMRGRFCADAGDCI